MKKVGIQFDKYLITHCLIYVTILQEMCNHNCYYFCKGAVPSESTRLSQTVNAWINKTSNTGQNKHKTSDDTTQNNPTSQDDNIEDMNSSIRIHEVMIRIQ